MKPEKPSMRTFLHAVLVMSALAGIGLAGAGFAAAQNGNMTTMNGTGNATSSQNANDTATASSSNASSLKGIIASIQSDENGNPLWITGGHWKLESDGPLVGEESNATDTQVNNFTATLYMVSNANGTDFHIHEVSNFTQTAILHQAPNSTSVNGTFTITLPEGPVNDVNGYINIINDKIEFWVDPVVSENHFGPTAIAGMVLDPEMIEGQMKSYGADSMGSTMTQQTNSTSAGGQY